jgi:hypothetical protein
MFKWQPGRAAPAGVWRRRVCYVKEQASVLNVECLIPNGERNPHSKNRTTRPRLCVSTWYSDVEIGRKLEIVLFCSILGPPPHTQGQGPENQFVPHP